MANKTHAIFNGTHCSYWDIDSLNYVGFCATSDLDNGVFVDLGNMSPNNDGAYEFTVTPSTTSAEFVCATPPQGYGIDAQVYEDPRYFTNEAGKPISVKHLLKYDCIEVDKTAFTAEVGTGTYAKVAAGGKLTAQANDTGAQFKIIGTHTIDCGKDVVATWILQKIV